MASNLEIVKTMFDASVRKDLQTVKALLHPEYMLKDPMMEVTGPDEMIHMMEQCPSACQMENVSFVADGDRVVGIWDTVMSEPVSCRMRMCSVMTLKDGKVWREEMFYDTAQIPAELKGQMQGAPGSQQAA